MRVSFNEPSSAQCGLCGRVIPAGPGQRGSGRASHGASEPQAMRGFNAFVARDDFRKSWWLNKVLQVIMWTMGATSQTQRPGRGRSAEGGGALPAAEGALVLVHVVCRRPPPVPRAHGPRGRAEIKREKLTSGAALGEMASTRRAQQSGCRAGMKGCLRSTEQAYRAFASRATSESERVNWTRAGRPFRLRGLRRSSCDADRAWICGMI